DETADEVRTVTPDAMAERLLKARTIIISGEINQRVAATVMAKLLAMAAESDDDITVYINSQGGHVEAGDTIHDLLRFVKPRIIMWGPAWGPDPRPPIFGGGA